MRLREMNNKPKEGGHASIDRLIAMSTLQGLKPMTMGGEITPNYSGGGLTGYENGGETQIDPRIMAKRIRGDVYSRSGLYDVEYDKEGVMRGARLRKELEGQPGYENFSDMVDNVGATVIQAEKDYYSDRGGYPVVGTSSTDPLVRAILKGEGYLDEARQQGDLVGYENGDTTFEDAVIAARTPFHNLKPNPDTGMYDIESIAGVAGDSGRNYYIGRGSAESPSAAAQAAHLMALKNSMSGEPMDIDPSDVGSYFKPKKKKV